MRDRIDPLIEERAPWLFAKRPGTRLVRRVLDQMLSYNKTLEIGETLRDEPTEVVMGRMTEMLCRDVKVTGLKNIPKHGAALIVANHPTGIADGIVMHHILAPIRPDLFIYTNADVLRVMPQLETMIAPVEWRQDKRSHGKTRETMAYTRRAIGQGRLGVIFPSGRLAKRRGLQLYEREWMSSAAMIARKFDLPVIPVNIRARNSLLFYLFDLIHPTLRDITLFHETLNKARQPFRVTIGDPISSAALPAVSDESIALLRKTTLALGGRYAPAVSLVDSTRPLWSR